MEPFAKEEIKVPYSEVIRLFVGSRPEGSEEILMQRAFFFQVPKLILIFPNEIDRPLNNRFILRAWGPFAFAPFIPDRDESTSVCYPFNWCTLQVIYRKMDPLREIQAEFARQEQKQLIESIDEAEKIKIIANNNKLAALR